MEKTASQPRSSRPEQPVNREVEQHVPHPVEDLLTYLRNYAREEPEVAACVCVSLGFILGWKMKPW